MRARLLASVAALGLSALPSQGCTVNADYAGVGFACSSTEPCQQGLTCDNGSCKLGPVVIDASMLLDVDVPDAQITECLPVTALSDQFPGDMLDVQWTASIATGTMATVAGGLVTFTPSTAVPPRFARIRSAPFAMDGKRVFAEVPMMVDPSTAAIGEILLGTSDTDFYFVRQSQGVLQFGTTIGGNELILTATSYEPGNHRWWQMRLSGGRLHADVSADGSDWVNLDSAAADVITGDLFVDIGAGTKGSVAAPGQMQVDNVNAGSGLCP